MFLCAAKAIGQLTVQFGFKPFDLIQRTNYFCMCGAIYVRIVIGHNSRNAKVLWKMYLKWLHVIHARRSLCTSVLRMIYTEMCLLMPNLSLHKST